MATRYDLQFTVTSSGPWAWLSRSLLWCAARLVEVAVWCAERSVKVEAQ